MPGNPEIRATISHGRNVCLEVRAAPPLLRHCAVLAAWADLVLSRRKLMHGELSSAEYTRYREMVLAWKDLTLCRYPAQASPHQCTRPRAQVVA